MSEYKLNFAMIKWPDEPVKYVRPARQPSKRANFPTPMISSDYAAYECPVTGKMIEGRYAHSENLKQTGCRLLENGELEDNRKNGKRYAEEKMDRAIDKAVDEVAKDIVI